MVFLPLMASPDSFTQGFWSSEIPISIPCCIGHKFALLKLSYHLLVHKHIFSKDSTYIATCQSCGLAVLAVADAGLVPPREVMRLQSRCGKQAPCC